MGGVILEKASVKKPAGLSDIKAGKLRVYLKLAGRSGDRRFRRRKAAKREESPDTAARSRKATSRRATRLVTPGGLVRVMSESESRGSATDSATENKPPARKRGESVLADWPQHLDDRQEAEPPARLF